MIREGRLALPQQIGAACGEGQKKDDAMAMLTIQPAGSVQAAALVLNPMIVHQSVSGANPDLA